MKKRVLAVILTMAVLGTLIACGKKNTTDGGKKDTTISTKFDEYDFSGKTLIPFNSHNGSRFSGTIETIQELEPDATVITDGFTVNERDVPEAKGEIDTWLGDLGY